MHFHSIQFADHDDDDIVYVVKSEALHAPLERNWGVYLI